MLSCNLQDVIAQYSSGGRPGRQQIDGVNYRPSLFSSSAVVSPLPTVALGFEGCPSVVSGQPGQVKTFDVFATLSTSTNVDAEGAQAWQLSLTADGGRIKALTVNGVMVSTIYDDDGLPETPPKNPYSFDLANADFKSSQLATFPADGREGAISTVFLGQDQLNVLQPNGTSRLAKITVEVTLPAGPAPATLTLRFEDGFKGSGLPLKNVATFEGVNYRPALGSCAVELNASTSNLILPGDCNADAKIDISDGICLLGYLFTGQTPDLPCDDAGAPTPGSLALMNFNGDAGGLDVTDAIAIFGYLFLGDPATFPCLESADTNNDGIIDISDGIYLLSWLFTGGPEPAGPGPTDRPCGFDPDPEGSAGDLGCESYACN